MTTPINFVVPASTAASRTLAFTGIGGYASTASTGAACAITGFLMYDTATGTTAVSGAWLAISPSTGNVMVDTNTVNS